MPTKKGLFMIPVITPKRAAQLDKYMIENLDIPGLLLMEQAATAIANEVRASFPTPCKVLVVCGKGNNGGDGWAAARILLTHGYDVYCLASSLNLPPDAAANQRFFNHTHRYSMIGEEINFFKKHSDAAVIIDALFGTGLTREVSGELANIIQEINSHPALVISADIPSGVFGQTGQCGEAVSADITVTFQYPKPAHFLFPGREKTGKLIVAKIGVDEGVSTNIYHLDNYTLQKRPKNTNKGSFGALNILAGSRGMAGAAQLTASASIAMGSGLTRVGCPACVADTLQHTVPVATVRYLGNDPYSLNTSEEELENFFTGTAIAAGPGLGNTAAVKEAVKYILTLDKPKVLDADALNALSTEPSLLKDSKNTVITPHPKEFSRLSGNTVKEILSDPILAASGFAKEFGVIVLLKGATTVVSNGTNSVLITAGSPAMAKGGSGDVLTGVIGSLLAQGYPPFEAAYIGAYLCGKAGEKAAKAIGEYSASATDTIKYLTK